MDIILSKLDKVESKIDKLDDRLDSSEKIAIKQESNLCEHMRRTDLLENSQLSLRLDVDPLLKIHTVIWGICKTTGALAILTGTVVGAIKIIEFL